MASTHVVSVLQWIEWGVKHPPLILACKRVVKTHLHGFLGTIRALPFYILGAICGAECFRRKLTAHPRMYLQILFSLDTKCMDVLCVPFG